MHTIHLLHKLCVLCSFTLKYILFSSIYTGATAAILTTETPFFEHLHAGARPLTGGDTARTV